MERVGTFLSQQDATFWMLVVACIGMVYTIQAVETAVDGAWPHQRRPARLSTGARSVQKTWSWVALLLLPGVGLIILNLAIIVWRGLEVSQTQLMGGVFVAIAWIAFVLVSSNTFGMGTFMGKVGPVGPLALMALLLVGDLLLLTAVLSILPTFDSVRDAVRGVLPF